MKPGLDLGPGLKSILQRGEVLVNYPIAKQIGRRSPRPSGQSGQVIVEYMLLLVIVIGLSAMVRNALVESKFIQGFTFQPWAKLDGMIQCGVWLPCGLKNNASGLHPDSGARAISHRPD